MLALYAARENGALPGTEVALDEEAVKRLDVQVKAGESPAFELLRERLGFNRSKLAPHDADQLAALAEYAAAEAEWRLEIAKQHPDLHLNPGYEPDQTDNKWSPGFSVELPVLNQSGGPIAEAGTAASLAESAPSVPLLDLGEPAENIAYFLVAEGMLHAAIDFQGRRVACPDKDFHAPLRCGQGHDGIVTPVEDADQWNRG